MRHHKNLSIALGLILQESISENFINEHSLQLNCPIIKARITFKIMALSEELHHGLMDFSHVNELIAIGLVEDPFPEMVSQIPIGQDFNEPQIGNFEVVDQFIVECYSWVLSGDFRGEVEELFLGDYDVVGFFQVGVELDDEAAGFVLGV